jgi:IMP and pyridine-specific 5'-nucleotidase
MAARPLLAGHAAAQPLNGLDAARSQPRRAGATRRRPRCFGSGDRQGAQQAELNGLQSGPGGAAAPAPAAVGLDWQELLSTPEPEMFGPRARSASDAAVLRRKGHLKEQDKFISFLLEMHTTHTSLEVMQKVERWVAEHRRDPRGSRLGRVVPTLGTFFTPLRLVDAFLEYDEFFALSRRQHVPPNFAEMRHVLNIAQVHASAEMLRLVTFDADGTLYADGAHMQHDSDMINLIIALMRANVHVAIVTAAGYPGAPERFEQRVEGLLAAFRAQDLPASVTARFHIMGGECNYLLRVAGAARRLEFVPDEDWKSPVMRAWSEADISALLAAAEALLLEGAGRLRLPVQVIRKERAVGVVPTAPTIYEVLEELAITVQTRLDSRLPFCAFNGGNDVFVDVGNKSLGLEALMAHLGFAPPQVLHVGDRFTASGNDSATRDCCSILWVANPEETQWFIGKLLGRLAEVRQHRYID